MMDSKTLEGGAFRCLIIEDDREFASLVEQVVRGLGGEVTLAASLGQARESLAPGRYDLVLLDNRLPDGTGYAFFPEITVRLPKAVVIMITGAPELSQAVALTRNGLFDYLTKPIEFAALEAAVERARLSLSRAALGAAPADLGVGAAPAFRRATDRLRSVARHLEAVVLLLGETGTGKDVAARQLHAWSFEGVQPVPPFVPLNCSAVPAEMFEAELFGSERGAYTGADRRRAGLVEAAEGGTLFLDEVGDVPLAQQSKLLRFLESREYRSLGATQSRNFQGRVVAATNRDLRDQVRRGKFREDLLYRLDVVRVELPPLRERREDIVPLTEYLLARLGEKYGRRRVQLRPDDLVALQAYAFPGNVRELRNILERSLLHTPDESGWLALERTWLPTAAEASSPASTTGDPRPRRELTPLEVQEYEVFKRTLIEEGGAIRRTAARLGVSHQVVLRRLRWWPELRELTRDSTKTEPAP